MIINTNGKQYENNYKWETKLHEPYNYERNGLLKYIMSHVIVNSKSKILQFILQYFEKSLIYCMKYADILNNYKNYMKHNR